MKAHNLSFGRGLNNTRYQGETDKKIIQNELLNNYVVQTLVPVKLRDKVWKYLKLAREKDYIKPDSEVRYVIYFLPVAKIWKEKGKERVVDEIRMIYDTTKSGLNDAVWDHWFTILSV